MNNLIKNVQNTAFQNELWQRGSKIVLGVSGGPDSVCLLDILSKIAPKAGLQLIIAHVNYGLRDKDSEQDEKLVKELTEKYGLIAYFLQPKISPKVSENELRNIRYAFFEKVRKENNFDAIAVAHNQDDQVETYLMRIIRGAGLQGLSAMKYKSTKIIRPLLGVSRQAILEYLRKNKLKFCTDKTNAESIFFRNKIRNNLIPYLERSFNPQIKRTIASAVVSIAEDHDFLNSFAAELSRGEKISVTKLLALHPALQRRVLLQHIMKARTSLKDIESAQVAEMLKALKSTKGKNQVVVFRGLKMARKGDKVILSSNF